MRVLAFTLTALMLAASYARAQAPIHEPQKLDRTDFQAAIADVGPAFVAGQPTADALRSMKAAGVTTVIVLRRQSELDDRRQVPFDEEALVKELGMTWVHIPLGGADPYTPAAVSKVNDAMKAAQGKVLLHCTIAWRASHMWAAYLATYRGYSVADAEKAGEAINMNGFKAPDGSQPFELLTGR